MGNVNIDRREEVLRILKTHKHLKFTCKEIAQKMTSGATARQVYDCIRNMPLYYKQQLKIKYGSGLFQPNKYGL